MVAVMAVIPVHLSVHHQHDLDLVGIAISLHLIAMFAPSPLTGMFADRFGADRLGLTGGVILLAAAGALWLAAPAGALAMALALALLGFGWNCGMVGGSAILAGEATTDSVPGTAVVAGRMSREATGELALAIAAAAGSVVAAVAFAAGGLPAVALACLAATLLGLDVYRRSLSRRQFAGPLTGGQG
jgi:MFS family permease